MPEISDERIQQMKDALEYCGWTVTNEDDTGITFNTKGGGPDRKAPVGTRYEFGVYETGENRVKFANWEHVNDMIEQAIYHSVEETANPSAKNYTKEHHGTSLNGHELEEAMYPERFNNYPEHNFVYIPNAKGKWADATRIDLREAHFSENTMTYEGIKYDLSSTYFYPTKKQAIHSMSEDGRQKDVHLKNSRVQIDSETGRPYYVNMGKEQEFPPCCFAVDSESHKLVMIQANENGTYATPIKTTNAVDNQLLADKLNARYGVTKDQASEMLYCAKNGWDKETREAWAEQKNNITPEQAEINAQVEKIESLVGLGTMNSQHGDISWELDKNGTLTISGTGEVPEYDEGQYPWSEYRDSIKNVVIEDGIKNVPDYAFDKCKNLESVDMPDSITRVGFCAFRNSGIKGDIELPENAQIDTFAFAECNEIDTVYCKGNTINDNAFYHSGAKEMRLDGCQVKTQGININYELTKVVSKNSEFEPYAVHENLNLENVVTENDRGIKEGIQENGISEPKISAIDSQDKTRQGGKYNIGKESIFGHMRRKLRHENKTVDKNAPSREAQKGKSQATDHAME